MLIQSNFAMRVASLMTSIGIILNSLGRQESALERGVLSHEVRGVSSWGICLANFLFYFKKVTLLSFQVNCPFLCVTSLTSPLIPNCLNLFPIALMCLIVCVSLCPVSEYSVQSCIRAYDQSPCLEPHQVPPRLKEWFFVVILSALFRS